MSKILHAIDLAMEVYQIPDILLSNQLNISDFILQATAFLREIKPNSLDLKKVEFAYFNMEYSKAIDTILDCTRGISQSLFNDISAIAQISQINDINLSPSRKIYEQVLGQKIWDRSIRDDKMFMDNINHFLLKSYDPITTLDKRELASFLLGEAISCELSRDIKSGVAMRAASFFIDKKIDEQIKEHRAKSVGKPYNDPSQLIDINYLSDEEKFDGIIKNVQIYSVNSLKVIARMECIVRLKGDMDKKESSDNNIVSLKVSYRKVPQATPELIANTMLILDLALNSKDTFAQSVISCVCGLILREGDFNLKEVNSALSNEVIMKLMKKHGINIENIFSQNIISEAFREAINYSKEIFELRKNQPRIENKSSRYRSDKNIGQI